MECTFQSLPFLFTESQKPVLLAWREAAVQREMRQARRRREQLLQLRQQVALRLLQHQLKQSNENQVQQSNQSDPSNQSSQWDLSTKCNQRKDQPNPLNQNNRDDQLTHHHSDQSQENQGPLYRDPPSPTDVLSKSNWSTPIYSKPLPQTGVYSRPLLRCEEYSRPLPQSDVYSKVTAMVRGFLTRRLLQSAKISSLITTIRDGGEVLAGLNEPLSRQDIALRDRVHTQMQWARLKLLEVVQLSVGERMAFICHDRALRTQRREREKVVASSTGRSGKLSTATQRAMQRRQDSLSAVSSPAPRSTRTKPVSKPAGQESASTSVPESTRTKLVLKPAGQESLSAVSSLAPRLTRTKPVSKPVGAGSKQRSPDKTERPCPIGQGTRTLQTPRTAARQGVVKTTRPKTSLQSIRHACRSTGTTLSGQAKSGQRKPTNYLKKAPVTSSSKKQ